MMKLHIATATLFLGLLSLSAYANPQASPKTQVVNCSSNQDGELSIQNSKIQAKLPTPPRAKSAKLKCERISWNQQTFIGVRYDTHEIISYESKLKDVTNYAIFKQNANGFEHLLSASVSGYSTAWMQENKYLVLRVFKAQGKAKPKLLEGYLFDPKSNRFTDLEAFAYMNNWPKK